jgi:hypothetical protein
MQHQNLRHTEDCSILIKQEVEEKRRLRRGWHQLRTPEIKRLLNTATQELKQLLNKNKNDCTQTFLQSHTPTESIDYSLWKATKKIKQAKKPSPPLRTLQGTWARSNIEEAHAFAEHLANVFRLHPSEDEHEEEEALIQLVETPYQLQPPINCVKRTEVQEVITGQNHKKSSGYDLITGKTLKELPILGIKYLTQLFIAVWHNGKPHRSSSS